MDVVIESRATVGLRPPRGTPRFPGPLEGVTVHYNGPPLRLRGNAHADCRRAWRGIQVFHMDDRGWLDVAYTDAVCHHGIVLAGRGPGVRTAANGTDRGNDQWLALYALIGEGEEPNPAMLSALRRRADQLAPDGRIVPHHFHKATACPGVPLSRWVASGAPDPHAQKDDMTPAQEAKLDEALDLLREVRAGKMADRDIADDSRRVRLAIRKLLGHFKLPNDVRQDGV